MTWFFTLYIFYFFFSSLSNITTIIMHTICMQFDTSPKRTLFPFPFATTETSQFYRKHEVCDLIVCLISLDFSYHFSVSNLHADRKDLIRIVTIIIIVLVTRREGRNVFCRRSARSHIVSLSFAWSWNGAWKEDGDPNKSCSGSHCHCRA